MNAPIVVGVDAERASGDALLWAVAEARRRHTWVLLLHATDNADAAAAARAGRTASMSAAALLRAHRRLANSLAPDVRTVGQVVGGSAVAALIGMSRRAGLLVIGSRGRIGLAQSALGSVSQQVVAHAHCPVVVVPQAAARLATRRIVVGIADVAADSRVLDVAAAEARRWGATLCVVHADDGAARQHAQAELDAAISHLRQHHGDIVVERAIPADGAVPALVAEASLADLLVLGCRHTEEEFGCRIGTVPAGVLPQLTCPVVLVPRASLAVAA
jgi:nucleotide-binding universal stress UspA family protein